MKKKIILLVPAVLFFSAQLAMAATVQFSWNPNTESDLAGYKIYYGTSPRAEGSYQETIVINDKNVTTYEVDMSPGTYYFALTAFDRGANESGFSTEVSTTVPSLESPGKPGKPVIIQ